MSDTSVAAVARQFAKHEFRIRRLFASNSEFRAVCEDYEAATEALALWEADVPRADDYRRLIGELEIEILEFLDEPKGRPAAAGS
ncbi:hypothetical protein [Mesorhizobium marinum]|uniref:Uncharacterized protein n=1 Tax=Mesorhizobium marinum TaxID=3228790 RepID=A0ABV3QWW4_9HYPH